MSPDALATLARGERIAVELPAKRAGSRRFVVATPFKDGWPNDPATSSKPWRFRVTRYELPAALCDESPPASLLLDLETQVVGRDELLAALAALAGDGARFESNRAVGAPY